MTTKERKPIEYYQARPERYKINDTGLVYDLEKKQIAAQFTALNPNAITPASSQRPRCRTGDARRSAAPPEGVGEFGIP